MIDTEKLKQAEDTLAKMNPEELRALVLSLFREQGQEVTTLLNQLLKEQPQVSINKRISNIFVMIGIPPHIKGYQYLREAIKICMRDTKTISSITKQLYPDVAAMFNTTASKVERAIRHAIEVCWNRGRIDSLNNLFGNKIFNKNERPTNGEFIALFADKLLLDGCSSD